MLRNKLLASMRDHNGNAAVEYAIVTLLASGAVWAIGSVKTGIVATFGGIAAQLCGCAGALVQ